MTDESLRDILDRIADLHRFRQIRHIGNIQLHAVVTTEDEQCRIQVNADKTIIDYIVRQAETQLNEYLNAIIAYNKG